MRKTARKASRRGAPRKASGKGTSAEAPDDRMFQLKVELMDIRPPIWRRVLVPGRTTLSELHEILQVVMGWEDYHLHAFKISEDEYGPPDPERMSGNVKDERKAVLSKVAPVQGAVFGYEYDFGDGWCHRISVEKVLPGAPEKGGGIRRPVCLEGARACPLEDCGGPPGYERLFEAMRDRDRAARLGARGAPALLMAPDPEWEEILDDIGDYDPEQFDIKAVNKLLEKLFR